MQNRVVVDGSASPAQGRTKFASKDLETLGMDLREGLLIAESGGELLLPKPWNILARQMQLPVAPLGDADLLADFRA